MPRQINDDEYAYLQARRQVADFVESIYNDPQLNKDAKRLIKRKYPNLQIPDYDLEEKLDARLDQDRNERQQVEEARRQQEEDDKYKKLRKRTQEEYGATEESMAELEQMMVDRNIGDYEAAAALKWAKNPPTSDSNYDNHYWNHEKQDGFQDIAKDPEGWARGEIMKSIRADQDRERGR